MKSNYNYYNFYIWDIAENEILIIKNYISVLNTQYYKRKDLITFAECEIDKEKTYTKYTVIGYKISVCGTNDRKLIDSFLKAFQKGIYINFYCEKR